MAIPQGFSLGTPGLTGYMDPALAGGFRGTQNQSALAQMYKNTTNAGAEAGMSMMPPVGTNMSPPLNPFQQLVESSVFKNLPPEEQGKLLSNQLYTSQIGSIMDRQDVRSKEERKWYEEMMLRRAKEQQKLGWQSNLIGFALKELPRVLTEPARRRNRYLDDLVLGTPGIAQQAFRGATGQATGDYSLL